MEPHTRRWAAAAGFTVVLALATPALASAQSSGAAVLSHSVQPLSAAAFPSANSTIIGSTGFIDTEQVGYFWSAARGDSVEETLSGPGSITTAKLKIDVPYNGLAAEAEVDWTLSINGRDVGRFTVLSGDTGPITEKYTFRKIKGGDYDVKIRVTNEVASGDGAITLRYAGDGAHQIALKK